MELFRSKLNNFSSHSEHFHRELGDEVAENHGKHHDQEDAAAGAEENGCELCHEFLAHQLAKHREGIERELDSADL